MIRGELLNALKDRISAVEAALTGAAGPVQEALAERQRALCTGLEILSQGLEPPSATDRASEAGTSFPPPGPNGEPQSPFREPRLRAGQAR
jgi:hypothetical protein